MQRLKAEEIKAGFSLAMDVIDENGRILVAKDTILTDSLIKNCIKRGIEAVYVHGKPLKKEEDVIDIQKRLEELEKRFNCVAGNELMVSLKNTIRDIIIQYDCL